MNEEEMVKLLSDEVGISESRILLNNSPAPTAKPFKEIFLDAAPTGIKIYYIHSRGPSMIFLNNFDDTLSEWSTWYNLNNP
jgi:hypothetical protein